MDDWFARFYMRNRREESINVLRLLLTGVVASIELFGSKRARLPETPTP